MPEVLFSIIIPTYNRGQLINKAIDSVLAQTYINLELIIVDDGSTDNTKSVIDAYIDPRIKYLYKQNEERGVARNTGMEIAEGDYITFLDSDDMLYPNHLMHALSKLKEFSFPEFYRQAYEIKDSSGNVLFRNNQLKGNANEFILKGNYFSCIGVFLKKRTNKTNKVQPGQILVSFGRLGLLAQIISKI